MKISPRKPLVASLLLGVVCATISLLLGWSSFARRVNLNFYDLYFRQRGPTTIDANGEASSSDIVIVAIDDATLARHGALPLHRALLAEGISRITTAGPRLLGIDILLVDQGADTNDAALEAALRAARDGGTPVVLSSALEAGSGWLHPLSRLAAQAARIGHVHADPDGDGVSRQVLLSKYSGRERLWAFALECVRGMASPDSGQSALITETPDDLEIAHLAPTASTEVMHIPAPDTTQRTLWINYAGPDGTFPRVSFAKLLDDPAASAELGGKIVLLGVTAQGTGDRLFTPYYSASGMPGIEIHANILHTLIGKKFLTPIGDAGVALAMLLIAAFTLLALARAHGPAQWLALLAIGATVVIVPYVLFLAGQIWPAFSLLLCFGVSIMAGEAYELLVGRRRYLDSENKRMLARQQFEMATHEMRTPLASIQASSELLARYALEPARREQMLRLLHEESQRLARLVERFLSVERLSAGELELRRAPVELTPLLTTISERIRPLAERKGLEFRVTAGNGPLTFEADAELLEFAVSNLLTNAVKYSPSGCWVLLEWRHNKNGVEIIVADNGPGIAQPDQRRLFDRFFRTAQAEHSTAPGFGLGLAIAREIITHHGGTVEVESAPSAGTRFIIQLPA
ncbi:MAG: CHASE2 domain-containing protein [Acidobacteria bacterium]|nr:CHASE2 domain-containing protein [Acidobacteriota bacterium]